VRINPIYTSGKYYRKNPTWDAKDSPWKAEQVLEMIQKHGLKPRMVADVGCGAGYVLLHLARSKMLNNTRFTGYEISPQAIKLCRKIKHPRVKFKHLDFLREKKPFDLALALDVIEHIEDCYGYLRRLRHRATYKMFIIPLDISSWFVWREQKTIGDARRRTGHLHHFTEYTALDTLRQTGYRVIDTRLIHLPFSYTRPRHRIMGMMRNIGFTINPHLTARLLGGASLLVLAK